MAMVSSSGDMPAAVMLIVGDPTGAGGGVTGAVLATGVGADGDRPEHEIAATAIAEKMRMRSMAS